MDENAALPLDLSAMLCFDIYGANLDFGRFYKPLLDPMGLTYPQYLVLVTLWQRDGQSVGEIGQALGLESSTLTPLIKRMQSAGLVQRRRDAADERRVLVTLTEQGAALQEKGAAVHGCVAEAVGLSLTEARQMQQMLRRLRQSLQDAPG